jgi:mRNA interferase RelE/StbE
LIWQIEWDDDALKELRKLGHHEQKQITEYLDKRIATKESPRRFGAGLNGDKCGLWRYRVADYRIICRLEDEVAIVLVVKVGHRRDVYDG